MSGANIRTLLVLGGARSGKSRYAQQQAEALAASGRELVYVATAQALDDEMAERVARHRAERDARWRTVEEPLDLASALIRERGAERIVLVDCLTLWASNLMFADRDVEADLARVVEALTDASGPILLVSNEVGLGIVPDNPMARRFRDIAGTINQAIAAAASEVVFVAAGLPLPLKP